MEGIGSVRDRIRAAELARQRQEGNPISPTSPRQGSRIALKQDEHVKEEFLKKGDGGWTKKVNVGQMSSFAMPRVVPAIQVTKPQTPVVAEKARELPGRINVPGAFDASDDPDSNLVPPTRRTRPVVTGASKKAPAKNNKSSSPLIVEDLLSSDIPPSTSKAQPNRRSVNFEDEEEDSMPSGQLPSRSRDSMAAKSAKQKDQKTSRESVGQTKSKTKASSESKKKKPSATESAPLRSPRPASKREERLAVPSDEDDLLDLLDDDHLRNLPRSTNRRAEDKDDSTDKPRARRKSSHQSPKIHAEDDLDTEDQPRRRSSLWPSFSHSQRRSIGNLMEGVPVPRPKSGHGRSKSADNTTVVSEKPPSSPRKELGFMEYVSGKKLDYIPESASKQKPAERMGYVRSRNSTGGYSERFTRNKRYLRKPDEDEFLEYETHERDRRSRRASMDQQKDEPWQVKFAKSLVKR